MGRRKKECPSYVEGLLGHVPDSKVAQVAEVSNYVARRWREDRGIPPFSGGRGRPSSKASMRERVEKKHEGLWGQLGTMRDSELGSIYGLSRERIRQFRKEAGIPKFTPPTNPLLEEVVGRFPDKDLADLFETTAPHVQRLRASKDRAPYRKWAERLEALRPLLGHFSDCRLAVLSGMPAQYVTRARAKEGIEAFTPSPRSKDFPKLDRDMIRRLVGKGHSDKEVGILMGCHAGSIAIIRTTELDLYRGVKRGGKPLSRYKVTKIRNLYRSGVTVYAVARETGHSESTVKKYIAKIKREGGSGE